MCNAHPWGGDDGLTCLRPDDEHDPNARGGHKYDATAGADLDNSASPKHHVTQGDQ